jgi:hypothetical protein
VPGRLTFAGTSVGLFLLGVLSLLRDYGTAGGAVRDGWTGRG